jgi:hypothetical protein
MFVNPNSPFADTQSRNILAAASAIGQQVHVLYVRTESDFETAFAALIEKRAGALVVGSDPFFDGNRDKLIVLAAHVRIGLGPQPANPVSTASHLKVANALRTLFLQRLGPAALLREVLAPIVVLLVWESTLPHSLVRPRPAAAMTR